MATPTPAHHATTRPRARHCLLAAAFPALVALSGCGDGDDPTATVTDRAQLVLADAARASSEASFRYEAWMAPATDASADPAVDGDPSRTEPGVTGEVDEGWLHTTVDMAVAVPALGEAMGDAVGGDGEDLDLPPGDLTSETITDGSVAFVHLPFLGAMPGGEPDPTSAPPDEETITAFLVLRDGWGRVDLGGLSPGEVPRMLGAEMLDPRLFLRMVERGRNVESTRTTRIDGTEARGLRADVSYESMIVAQGLDPADARDRFEDLLSRAGDGDPEEVEAAVTDVLATELPVEVWVDPDGHVRRATMVVDLAAVLGAARDVVDEPIPDGVGGLALSLDLFDYDDPSIVVTPPASSTDITDAFLRLVED